MTHQQFKDLVARYLSGRASANEETKLEHWLQRIEDHALDAENTGEFLSRRDRIYTQLKTQVESTPLRSGMPVPWRSIAASVVFFVTAWTAYFFWNSILDVIDPIAEIKITASPFEIRKVILPDSSVAIVNGGSSIQYPERFRGERREVCVNGETFFDVRKDPAHPFRIRTRELNVQVLGTSFVVTDYGRDSVVKVVVRSGRVSVSSSDNDLGILVPYQNIQYNKATREFDVRQGVEADIHWTRNQLSFRETKLKDVFDLIARSHRVVINAEDPKMLLRTFTGSFEQADTPGEMLKIISLSYGWKVEHDGGGYVIRALSPEPN